MSDQPRAASMSAAGGVWGVARRIGLGLAIVLGMTIALYYPIGMLVLHTIDDNPDFQPGSVPNGGSRAVAMAAALIDREVDGHAWVANDPFFLPGWALDNMANYQQGIVGALSRFAVEMGDQIARTRGSSRVDQDLDRAAGLLKYPGNVWIFDLSTSFAPTASSEAQYRAARKALLAFNERLATHKAVFERRADNLLATLDRIAVDLGSSSALIEKQIAERSGNLLDFAADDTFYATKGRLYAYFLVLRELGKDFDRVIVERDAARVWGPMIDALREAASLQPWVVFNGAPDSQFLPNHLTGQGFYLLRARMQMRELTDILRK